MKSKFHSFLNKPYLVAGLALGLIFTLQPNSAEANHPGPLAIAGMFLGGAVVHHRSHNYKRFYLKKHIVQRKYPVRHHRKYYQRPRYPAPFFPAFHLHYHRH